MFFSDLITLKDETITQNENGYPVTSYTDKQVWANKKSVTRSEFYSANANGINIVIAFEVHDEDYTNQKYISYDDVLYEVVRTYQRKDIIELNCKAV